jgi:nucleotidyltransferase substrate binding protein (TIGR01987 family)
MDQNPSNIRWRQRFQNFEKAFALLEEAVKLDKSSDLEKAGRLHVFEIVFELAWKLMKDYLKMLGFVVKGPRDAIKQAFREGIIDNGEIWLEALKSRNEAAHIYNEEKALLISDKVEDVYFDEIKKLHSFFMKEIEDE